VSPAVTTRSLARNALSAVALAVLFTSIGQAAATAAPRKHMVIIEGTRFQPESLTVKAGDTIVWVNKDLFPHTATASSSTFDSQVIAAGASWKYVAKKKGEFAYGCLFHPTMKADLLVK
jgi:plastocyanin